MRHAIWEIAVYILREEGIPAEVTKKFLNSPKTLQFSRVLVTERAPYILWLQGLPRTTGQFLQVLFHFNTPCAPGEVFLGLIKTESPTMNESPPTTIPRGDSNHHRCISTRHPGSRLNRTWPPINPRLSPVASRLLPQAPPFPSTPTPHPSPHQIHHNHNKRPQLLRTSIILMSGSGVNNKDVPDNPAKSSGPNSDSMSASNTDVPDNPSNPGGDEVNPAIGIVQPDIGGCPKSTTKDHLPDTVIVRTKRPLPESETESP
jgi:hypothetical protein